MRAYETCSCGKVWNVSLLRKKTDVYVCPECEEKQAKHVRKKRKNDNPRKHGVCNRP